MSLAEVFFDRAYIWVIVNCFNNFIERNISKVNIKHIFKIDAGMIIFSGTNKDLIQLHNIIIFLLFIQ